jgi:pimeloyl-ACP methyl ester carboxylesterase
MDQPRLDATREEALWIDGPFGKLFAVVHRPPAETCSSPCIIMLNAGYISRVGPQRLYVTAARRWADQGFTCLRVDLAGVGDSQAENDAPHFDAHFPEEVIATVNYAVRDLEATSVYLVGMCAGARVAIKAAARCDMVNGVVAWSCPTLTSATSMPSSPYEDQTNISDWQARDVLKRLAESILQLKFLRPAWWSRRIGHWSSEVTEFLLALKRFVFRTKVRGNPYLDAVDKLLHTGRNVFFVFGECDPLPLGEFRSMYGTIPQSTELSQACHVIPDATHTFNEVDSQRAALSASTDWLRARVMNSAPNAGEGPALNP